jgi:hypothetical protein
MATHTQIPHENLSAWYFAVRWSRTNLEATIEKAEAAGLSCKYDRMQQERLEELELYSADDLGYLDGWYGNRRHGQAGGDQ